MAFPPTYRQTDAHAYRGQNVDSQVISSRIERLSNRITKISTSDYPVWVMDNRLAAIKAQRLAILERLEVIGDALNQALANGKTEIIEVGQLEAKKLRKSDQALEEEFQKLFNQRQTKILKERITEKLGGQRIYQAKEILITILVALVLSLMVYEAFNPDLADQTLIKFFWLDTACCIIFMVDFFFELNLADSKKWFWQRHFIDFITSIPVPQARTLRALRGVRVIRLLRFARFLRFLRFLRVLRVVLFFWRGLDHLVQMFNVKLMRKSLIYVCVSLVLGAIAFQFFENTELTTEQNTLVTSLWWSFTTVVTGGFADIHDPVTMGGKALTVILVILGMVLVGIFTATLTTVMVEDEDDIEQLKSDMNHQFDQLLSRVNLIEQNTRLSPNGDQSV
ncbi:MAG: ion transporter [Cyanobacteria bacterium J06638_28]